MMDLIVNKAIEEKFNFIAEGTFRTVQTPLDSIKQLIENN